MKNFKPIFPVILRRFDLKCHRQTSLKAALAPFGLAFIKFRKLKNLHWENKKRNLHKAYVHWPFQLFPILWGKNCFQFFFWIFLIDVIKLEYGKVLLLSSFPVCSWIVHLCNSPSTLVSLQNFLLAFPHNLLQVSSPLQLDLLLLVTCTNISIRQVMLMKLHILLNLIVKSEFYLKGLDFTLLQHTTWIYSVF